MIGAVVLAAGESRRMGRPKMLLPWGKTTVIGQVVNTLLVAGVDDVIVVAGALLAEIEVGLLGLNVRTAFNPDYANGDMAATLQVGLLSLRSETEATLVVLGDQPQIEGDTIRLVIAAYQTSKSKIVVPSFEHRRGHPWLITRPLWRELHRIQPPTTLRGFLNSNNTKIEYVSVETPSVLADLDTPADYDNFRPK